MLSNLEGFVTDDPEKVLKLKRVGPFRQLHGMDSN